MYYKSIKPTLIFIKTMNIYNVLQKHYTKREI